MRRIAYRDLLRTLSLLALCSVSASAERIITTVAGSARVFRGDRGPATEANLGPVKGAALDPSGNLYVVDAGNCLIVKISPDGTLTVVAGNGIQGFSGDGGPATNASLSSPEDVAVDAAGKVFIADTLNRRIRQVSPDGIISTVAGSGRFGFSGDGGAATSASLGSPVGVTVDAAGNLFIADRFNHRIRQVSPVGIIRTYAGTGFHTGFIDGEGGDPRDDLGDGGPATDASLLDAVAVAADAAGNLFIADRLNYRVRQVSPDGIIRTVAGKGISGFSGDGGLALDASLANPQGVAIDAAGNLFIADAGNGRIRQVSPDGIIQTVAGRGEFGFSGDGGNATNASVNNPQGVAVDAAGNLFIADRDNNRVRQVSADGIIQTIAGNGDFGFSGDGGNAANAALLKPEGVEVDEAGNLLIADTLNNRIRRVGLDGIIRTVAGNGNFGSSHDGGRATSAPLARPVDVAADAAGTLFITDGTRIRGVSPDGIIRTVAGRGNFAFSGDGGPAVSASLAGPKGVAVDAAGNLFIADSYNERIRRVGPDGIIQTVAGNGTSGFSGDGGPATNASLALSGAGSAGVAVDGAGNLFIADRDNNRIRLVSPDGIIQTVAGNGDSGFSGDAGPAVDAALSKPGRVAVDAVGNLVIADTLNNRIRQVSPDGFIRTVAGNGIRGFSGDGGAATSASLGLLGGVAVDAAGNLFIADTGNSRVRVVLANPPRFRDVLAQEIALVARSGGAPVEAEPVIVSTSAVDFPLLNPSSLPQISFSAVPSEDANWLSVSPTVGQTPRQLRITADPAALAPGEYRGTVTIMMPDAAPSQQLVNVNFSVGQPLAPRLSVEADSFSFTYPTDTPARSESFTILNTGGGSLEFSVLGETDSGGEWLTIRPDSGSATPSDPVMVAVTADPEGLPIGTYTGWLRVEAEAEGSPAFIPVTMTISDIDQAILLSQSGLSFTAVEQGGIVPPQTFGVVNLGRGSMGWSVTRCTLIDTSCEWLSVTPDSGTSNPNDEVPQVTVTIDQTGLAPGDYYGLVEARSAQAANTPQVLSVFLEVLLAGSDPGAALTDNELVFTAVAGAGSPSSQDIFAYNVAAEPKSYRSSRAIDRGRLEILPVDGVLDPQQPTRVVVQPFTAGVPAGDYEGNVTLQFSDGRVQEVDLRLVVTKAEAANLLKSPRQAQEACVPTKLMPALRTLGSGFAVSGGWPVGLQVDVKNDCGRPLKDGSVVVEFSNGDPELAMISLNNGRWDGTWQTNPSQLSDVTLRVEASQPSLGLEGRRVVPGRLRSLQEAPVLPKNGVTGSAGFLAHQPLAPGSLISLFGLNFSEGQGSAEGLPLPEELQSTRILFAGQLMPLLFTSDGQINAMVPYELNVNTQHQILVQRGPTLAEPVSVDLAATQPAIFRTSFEGTQGLIYKCVQQGTNNCVQVLTDENNPATAGDVLVMYCSGLGEVDPPVAAGVAAGPSRTVDELTVEIGGRSARVAFSGLAPGFSGLYQVNAAVPDGVDPSPDSQVSLRISGQTSALVTMAVQ